MVEVLVGVKTIIFFLYWNMNRPKNLFTLVVALAFFVSESSAQTFSQLYGGGDNDKGQISIELTSGDFIIFGQTISSLTSRPLTARCINQNGDELWYETYTETDSHFYTPHSAIHTQDGNILIGGSRSQGPGDTSEFVLTKITPSGGLIWFSDLGGYWRMGVQSVHEYPDGSIVALGSAFPESTFSVSDILIARFSAIGEFLWSEQIETQERDGANASVLLENGDLMLVGSREVGPDNDADILLLHVSPFGIVLWEETYDVGLKEGGFDIVKLSDGGFFIVGAGQNYPDIASDIVALRTTEEGLLIWIERYGTIEEESCHSLVIDNLERAYLSGFSTDLNNGETDALLMCINSDGDSLWSQNFGYTYADEFEHILKTSQGNLLMTGFSEGDANVDDDEFVVLSDMTGIVSVESIELPVNIGLSPNPNNGEFEIQLSYLSEQPEESIVVYDLVGNEVYRSSMVFQLTSTNLNLSYLINGVYLVAIEQNGQILGTSQLMIVK